MTTGNTPASTPSASGRAPSLDRDALALVLAALDLPHAATMGEEEKRAKLMERRITETVVFLEGYLDPEDHIDDIWVQVFRDRIAEQPPINYVTDAQAQARLAEGATWAEAVRPGEEVA